MQKTIAYSAFHVMAAAAVLLPAGAQPQASHATHPSHATQSSHTGTAVPALAQQEHELRAQLLKQPKDAALLTRLGIVLQIEGRSAEAIATLEQSLRLRPDTQTAVQLAEERCRVGQVETARGEIDTLLRVPDLTVEQLRVIAPCTFLLERPALAVEAYSRVVQLEPASADAALLQLARAYLAVSRDAYNRLNQLPESAPLLAHFQQSRAGGSFDTGAELAWLHTQDAKIPADAPAQALLAQDGPDSSATLLYAIFIAAEYAAEDQIEQCHQRFPNSPYLADFHAGMLAQQGDTAGAIAILEPLVAGPDAAHFRDSLITLYLSTGRTEDALALAKAQLKDSPTDGAALRAEADALSKLERFPELRSLLEPRWSPAAPLWLAERLAEAQEHSNARAAAVHTLKAAEDRYPQDRSLHYRLMRLYLATGQRAAADRERALFGQAAPAADEAKPEQ